MVCSASVIYVFARELKDSYKYEIDLFLFLGFVVYNLINCKSARTVTENEKLQLKNEVIDLTGHHARIVPLFLPKIDVQW